MAASAAARSAEPPRRSAGDPKTIEFQGVTTIPSGEHTLYEFPVTAVQLAALARIHRYADGEGGVQRQARAGHVKAIAQAMVAGQLFPDSITGNLGGDWIVDSEGRVILGNPSEAHLEIIDGQHRVLALRALLAAGRNDVVARYTFTVAATHNASDHVRRALFLAQDRRLRIESSHALELRAKSGTFQSETERRSYELLRRLNTDDRSPFKGRIIFGDAKDERGRTKLQERTYAARSFLNQLRPIMSNTGRSPLSHLSHDRRADIVINLFAAAASQYSNFIVSPDHVLGQPLGFTALLALLAIDGEFHLRAKELQGDSETGYEEAQLGVIFETCARFQWKARSRTLDHANKSPVGIARRFNEFLREHRGQAAGSGDGA